MSAGARFWAGFAALALLLVVVAWLSSEWVASIKAHDGESVVVS